MKLSFEHKINLQQVYINDFVSGVKTVYTRISEKVFLIIYY